MTPLYSLKYHRILANSASLMIASPMLNLLHLKSVKISCFAGVVLSVALEFMIHNSASSIGRMVLVSMVMNAERSIP